jgi:hypothetical protein
VAAVTAVAAEGWFAASAALGTTSTAAATASLDPAGATDSSYTLIASVAAVTAT